MLLMAVVLLLLVLPLLLRFVVFCHDGSATAFVVAVVVDTVVDTITFAVAAS